MRFIGLFWLGRKIAEEAADGEEWAVIFLQIAGLIIFLIALVWFIIIVF